MTGGPCQAVAQPAKVRVWFRSSPLFPSIFSLHFKVENQWQPTITCLPLLVLGAPDLLPPGPGIVHACPSFSPSCSPRKAPPNPTGRPQDSGSDVALRGGSESRAARTDRATTAGGEAKRYHDGKPASAGEESGSRCPLVGEEAGRGQTPPLQSDPVRSPESESPVVLDFAGRRRRAPPFFVRSKAGADQADKVTLAEDSRAVDLLRRYAEHD